LFDFIKWERSTNVNTDVASDGKKASEKRSDARDLRDMSRQDTFRDFESAAAMLRSRYGARPMCYTTTKRNTLCLVSLLASCLDPDIHPQISSRSKVHPFYPTIRGHNRGVQSKQKKKIRN
jgi:hypothetical protein